VTGIALYTALQRWRAMSQAALRLLHGGRHVA